MADTPPEPSIPLAQLPEACREAKEDFRPLGEANLQPARTDLTEALGRLDQSLCASGKKGEDWRAYLNWDDIQTQLDREEPLDLAVLDALYKKLTAGHAGLRLVQFVDVREALWRYITVARSAQSPDLKQGYEKLMDDLADRLGKYLAEPDAETALVLGEAVRWLDATSQAPELIDAVQHHLVRPNLLLQVSADVVAAGIAGPVDDTEPVREVILGTNIHGTGHTTGETTVRLIPDPDRAVIEVILRGTTESDNIGYNGPVRIHSTGTTQIDGRKRLRLDATGIDALPATSDAATRTDINGIRSKRGSRVVERAARRRASEQKGQAEVIASQRAERRVNERIDCQAAEMIDRVNRAFVDKFRKPLRQRKLFPRQLAFSTTDEALHVAALQASAAQLAAPTAPPELAQQPDLAVRVHESLINNLAAEALAGLTLRDETLQSALVDLLGELPDRLKADEDEEPWGITFADRQPISVAFADGQFRVTIRGRRYYKGEERHPGMDVTAVYKLAVAEEGLRAVRQGDLRILPPNFVPDKDRLAPRQIVIQTLLERRFGKIFKEEMIGEGLLLPGNWEKAGKMRPVQLVCQHGWLTIAWKRSPVDESVADAR